MIVWLAGNRKGFTAFDALITLCLIALLFGVVVPRYQRVALEARESALKAELVNIRTSIRLFKMLNNRNPGSLRELVEREVMLPARVGKGPHEGSFFKPRYLMPNAVDADGNVLDSFGTAFQYDPLSAEVRSATRGYEKW